MASILGKLSDNTGGAEIRPEFQAHAVKPEAPPIAYGVGEQFTALCVIAQDKFQIPRQNWRL